MQRRALGFLLLAACGGSDGGADARTDHDARSPGPNVVTLSVSAEPYLAYRDGTGLWLTPDDIGGGDYELHVTRDYQLVVACSDDTGFETQLIASTFADGDSEFAFCGRGRPESTTVEVTGQMVQAGTLWMYDYASSGTGPWDFSLAVPPGLRDLIAVGEGRIVIRRNQNITALTSIGAVDVVQDGSALVAIPLSIGGVEPGDTVTTQLVFFADNDLAFIDGTSDSLLVPPNSLVEATDFQDMSIFAQSATTSRTASTIFTGTQTTTFQLSPPLTGISYSDDGGVLSASWSELPAYDSLTLRLSSTGSAGTSMQLVRATPAWIDETNATSLTFDVDPPGLDPTWQIDLEGPYLRSVRVYEYRSGIGYSTSAVERVNGAIEMPPTHNPELQRARGQRMR